jgi:alkylation response protein AidB-like acyl-CoA dehydrogenase
MLQSANLSFSLCPMLTDSAIEALLIAGTSSQKDVFLPKLTSGSWTGAMNLTEPQAGSDLSLVTTKAEPQKDGRYKIFGVKIFITYGEHDLSENIIHLVLARLPNAPEGVRGLSLFIVPKYLVLKDGSLGGRNDVHCLGLEHKLGIKASPTATLVFGERGDDGIDGPGAVGELLGQENRGLETMFIMMNAARFGVGLQGVALAQRAYQQAVDYAKERIQSRPVDGTSKQAVPIIEHPDVRRMLMTMRALTEGARAMALVATAWGDQGLQSQYELLVPVIKGFCTEMSQEVAGLALQVHGGMGFIEETGVAQYVRDARILTIYEGTTAIQANDLISRKILRDGGAMAHALARQIQETEHALKKVHEASHSTKAVATGAMHEAAQTMVQALRRAREKFLAVVDFVVAESTLHPNRVFAGSVPCLMLTGYMVCGWQMARALLVTLSKNQTNTDPCFLKAKAATAVFYAQHLLPRVDALAYTVLEGGDSVMGLSAEDF